MSDDKEDPNKTELSLKEKLKSEIEEADWSMLEPHFSRQAIVQVSSDLDLPTVSEKVAMDDVDSIKKWMTEGKVVRPTEEQVNTWKENPYKKAFQFIIVQPYVLIQEKLELKQ
ncbi:MAG: DUF2288 family protein [Bacteriovoracaceae bacterium]|nr:DUF2288 family protein [Bacteriovoracaceae bacterium]